MATFGLWIQLRPGDDIAAALAHVAALGFAGVHAHFPEGCDETMARAVATGAIAAGLEVSAISGYANPLRPAEAPMGATLAQLNGLVRLMPVLGARRLVSWSGTYGASLLDHHPANQSEQAWAELRRWVEHLLPLLEAADATLALEPWYTHVLNTPNRLARFCGEFCSPRVSAVFDPPNLLPPGDWPEQAGKMLVMAVRLAPYVSLAHLKDMRMEGEHLELPGPGGGILDYPALRRALADSGIVAPLIVEHVSLDQAAAALAFVQRIWEARSEER